ncbi:MAG: hypothetical protein CMO80_15340 [Verrucomicrobiales bacterium]|nr:hypothetical protein [Verrucomicrobiales bacterium]|tara:strand:+ start:8599 stop:11448 length:2850 start_codon:yes stop_codon:yes gene_type:complete
MKNHIIAASALLITAGGVFADDSKAEFERLFTLRVKPLLSEKCFGCHGGDLHKKPKGSFDLTTRSRFLKGGSEFSNALVPGSSAQSYVMKMIKWEDEDYEMPPKKNDRLNEEQIADFARWIDAGAPWPSEERQKEIHLAEQSKKRTKDGVMVTTSGGLADEWTFRRYQPEDIWAFQPVKKPRVKSQMNPIDALVRSKLSKAGFKPAPKADARTLIRRATYDLTGLPPTPNQVYKFHQAYQKDPDQAWSDLIDRLLASRHYGERWAQHWLDVARYADTGGYSNDYERSNMWRYRDYVIRAFNSDKPYNQFIIEQLAGDELADASLNKRIKDWNKFQSARQNGKQYNDKESQLLVASSFLRMGPWDPAMVKKPQARQIYLDDVVNAVGQTFMSTTMRCLKCHDHKFDPLPTRDYYRVYAAFEPTQLAERPVPFAKHENLERFEEGKAMTERLWKFASAKEQELIDKREATARKWYKENNREYKTQAQRKSDPDDEKPPRHAGLDYIEQGRLKVRAQDEWIWNRRKERYQPYVQTVYNGPVPGGLNARRLRMNAKANNKWRPDSRILTGGALEAPGDQVTPGVLSALAVPVEGAPKNDPYQIGDKLNGRRLALARWIADERNPLTTRSIVNRVWQYHFGKAIAGNPNNFGVKGSKPTHPRVLDYLAADFVENGWTIKRLHKLIMTSMTYQQSGKHPDMEKLLNEDPKNNLFAYFPSRRLSAEEIRDGMLKITGELNTKGGGVPIKPEMNMEVALQPRMIQFSIAPAYTPSRTPDERNRRSIYAYRVRGLANPFLETFNRPNPNDSCEERDAASVSPQAFTLLNSDVTTARSIAFALRVEKDADNLTDQIKRVFHLAFTRHPSAQESSRMAAYVKEMRTYHKKVKPERKTYPTKITRSLVEEFSGKPFEYEEILPVFENYIPDKQAADVGPNTRAMADLCLLLFNSHEFMYLY